MICIRFYLHNWWLKEVPQARVCLPRIFGLAVDPFNKAETLNQTKDKCFIHAMAKKGGRRVLLFTL